MPQYPVTKAHVGEHPSRLHDALLAAGLAIETVLGTDANTATVLADAAGLQAQIDAVVASFDPTQPAASEQQEVADTASLQTLRAQYQTLKDGLVTIRTHMATIQATPNPTTANLAAVVGVANAVKQVAADVTTLTNGLDRLLDTLAVFARRQS